MTEQKKTNGLNGQRIAFLLLIIVGGFFLWTQHQAHIMGALPYLILLLCPLMHFFMHKGHGKGHGGHGGGQSNYDHENKGDAS